MRMKMSWRSGFWLEWGEGQGRAVGEQGEGDDGCGSFEVGTGGVAWKSQDWDCTGALNFGSDVGALYGFTQLHCMI